MADEYENEIDEKTIQEQYRVWKKNVPYLYDTMVTAGLDWPSLTVQFFGEREVTAGSDFSTHKVLLGTHTSGEEPNHLMIAKVLLPNENAVIDESKYDDERVELGGYAASKPKFEIVQRIVHDREVNRARICPQNSFLIATKSPSADVLVFDTGKHPLRPADAHRNTCRPNLRLKGHELEGYGLAWNDKKPGEIISGGDDKLICFWDITGSPVYSAGSSSSGSSSSSASSSSSPVMSATRIIRGHKEVVEDVAWHRHHPEMFGSVGDDSMLMVWDMRDSAGSAGGAASNGASSGGATCKMSVRAHDGDAMSLSFNPYNEHLLLTGGTDKVVKLWDMRKLTKELHTFVGHDGDVTGVSWSPFDAGVFASCASDHRVVVWDCARIGKEQDDEDAEDGPPELLFMHGGHTAKVSDFSWSETEHWVIASVAEDNVFQVWQMAENVYSEEAGDDEAGSSEDDDDESGDDNAEGSAGEDNAASKNPRPAKKQKTSHGDDDLE